MTESQAIEIINKIRCSNSFTMGLSIEEYIKKFRKQYLKIYGIVVPNNVIDVAKVIKTLQ